MLDFFERPPIAQAPVSVILLPGHSDQTEAWTTYLETLSRPYEVVPVSAEALADGYGPALQAALQAAQHPLVLLATADQQFRPDETQRFFDVIDRVDLVIGCRVSGPAPFWRRALDRVIGLVSRVVLGLPLGPRLCWLGSTGWGRRWLTHWVFGVRLHDPYCPFRLFRREALTRFPLQSRGPFALVEMLAKANHLECLMTEEPVTWMPPATPSDEGVSFRADAWQLFHEPEFVLSPTPQPETAAEQ